MATLERRSIYQILIIISLMSLGFASGCFGVCAWVFSLVTGSDHGGGHISSESIAAGPDGILSRWHDYETSGATMSDKDLAYWHDWLMQNEIVIGLQIPQAPGASAPGILTDANHNISVVVNYQGESIELREDATQATRIAAIFPPDPNTHWQALVPADREWMSYIPTTTTTISNVWGSLFYQIDFQGDDLCQGCEIKLTACTDYDFNVAEEFSLNALGMHAAENANGLTCLAPRSTYVTIIDWANDRPLPPHEPRAAFSPWGGEIFKVTDEDHIELSYALSHNLAVTQTFTLEPVQSAHGWTYEWQNPDGQSITQIEIPPNIFWDGSNVQLAGSGLPICSQEREEIHLVATSTLTPTFQATSTTWIITAPDPDHCPVADVGIVQIASTEVITAGEWISYTYTITNYETSIQNVAVTSTLSSSAAVKQIELPEWCTHNGAVISCEFWEIPGQDDIEMVISIQLSLYGGDLLVNKAIVKPIGALDNRFYDNSATTRVSIQGGSGFQLFLPLTLNAP